MGDGGPEIIYLRKMFQLEKYVEVNFILNEF